jgi:hypothetical protein
MGQLRQKPCLNKMKYLYPNWWPFSYVHVTAVGKFRSVISLASFENSLKRGSRLACRVCELRVFYATYLRRISDVHEPRYGLPVT